MTIKDKKKLLILKRCVSDGIQVNANHQKFFSSEYHDDKMLKFLKSQREKMLELKKEIEDHLERG
jgi:hypothetical protein